ncbi:MAG: AAA family ATPase, partial [Prevotella sp.]|nr:AAA family ATPase [Prevotella sp.]
MGEIEAREEMLTEKDPDLQEIEADVITILDSVTLNDAIEQGKQLEPLKALVYPYFWEEELVLFFADNGVGKSILATQIAQYIAEGKGGESLEVQTEAQKVLYFPDFDN